MRILKVKRHYEAIRQAVQTATIAREGRAGAKRSLHVVQEEPPKRPCSLVDCTIDKDLEDELLEMFVYTERLAKSQ